MRACLAIANPVFFSYWKIAGGLCNVKLVNIVNMYNYLSNTKMMMPSGQEIWEEREKSNSLRVCQLAEAMANATEKPSLS